MMKADDCHKPAIVTCSRHLVYVDDRKRVDFTCANVGRRSANEGLANVIRHWTEANTRLYT